MILWKHHVSEDFEDGYAPNAGVGKGGYMRDDLAALIAYCREDGRAWSIARIICDPEDVELDSTRVWYIARCSVISEEGFIPLAEAERKYLRKERNQYSSG